MLRKVLGMIVMIAGMAGCASAPADKTPLNDTAVIEEYTVNNGIKGFFPSESTDVQYIRADKYRHDHNFKGTGTFSGVIVGSHSRETITRVDRKLVWYVNLDKSQYSECPLSGCVHPTKVEKMPERPKAERQQPPEAPHQQGCTVRVTKSEFTVTPTGKKQNINGFDTDEYQVSWIVTLSDSRKRTDTSELHITLWTTPETSEMQAVKRMESTFQRTRAEAESADRQASALAAKAPVLPASAIRPMMGYLARSMKSGDLNAFFAAGKQMNKIKGHPILTQITWDFGGNACAQDQKQKTAKRDEDSGQHIPTSASGLTGMLFQRKVESDMKAAEKEHLLSFTFEVKKYRMEPQHDSVFEVPAGYNKVQE